MPVDAALSPPLQDGVRGQLRARIAAQLRDLVEFARDANAGERDIGYEAYAFPVGVVDHRKDAKAPAVDQRIPHNPPRGRRSDRHRSRLALRFVSSARGGNTTCIGIRLSLLMSQSVFWIV